MAPACVPPDLMSGLAEVLQLFLLDALAPAPLYCLFCRELEQEQSRKQVPVQQQLMELA